MKNYKQTAEKCKQIFENCKKLPPLKRILALPIWGQKCLISELQPFEIRNSDLGHPVIAIRSEDSVEQRSSIIKDPRFDNDFREEVVIDVLENQSESNDDDFNHNENNPNEVDDDIEEIENLIVKEAKQMIEYEGLKDEVIKGLLKDDKNVEKRPQQEYFSVESIQKSAIPLRSKVLKVNKDHELMEQLKSKDSRLKMDLKKKTKNISESTVDRINLSLINYNLWKIQVNIS